jgi:hypothetical protein
MPLIDNVIAQLGKSYWFKALDLQASFWQVCMAPEDVKKIMLITSLLIWLDSLGKMCTFFLFFLVSLLPSTFHLPP